MAKRKYWNRKSSGDIVFDAVNAVFMVLVAVVML
jgi:hypothetical protein